MKKKPDSVDEFDFGFSFIDEDIEQIKETSHKIQQEHLDAIESTKELEHRIDLLYNSILPFLDNLCKNAEKPTIHWPNRVEKIEKFKKKLNEIIEGNY